MEKSSFTSLYPNLCHRGYVTQGPTRTNSRGKHLNDIHVLADPLDMLHFIAANILLRKRDRNRDITYN